MSRGAQMRKMFLVWKQDLSNVPLKNPIFLLFDSNPCLLIRKRKIDWDRAFFLKCKVCCLVPAFDVEMPKSLMWLVPTFVLSKKHLHTLIFTVLFLCFGWIHDFSRAQHTTNLPVCPSDSGLLWAPESTSCRHAGTDGWVRALVHMFDSPTESSRQKFRTKRVVLLFRSTKMLFWDFSPLACSSYPGRRHKELGRTTVYKQVRLYFQNQQSLHVTCTKQLSGNSSASEDISQF